MAYLLKLIIPASTFLFVYEGELISEEEGNRRLETNGFGPGFIFFLPTAKKWYTLHVFIT